MGFHTKSCRVSFNGFLETRGAPTAVLSPACRSAAVRMGRGGTARPPEAEWSSGVAAFLGGVF